MKHLFCIMLALLLCVAVELQAQETATQETEAPKVHGPLSLEKVTVFVRGAGVHKQEGIYEWVNHAVQLASMEGFVPPKDIAIVFQEDTDREFRDGTSISITLEPKPRDIPVKEGRAPVQLTRVTIALDGEEVFKQEDIYEWGGKAAQLVIEWFPILDKIFETEGFTPTDDITLRFRRMDGVANASGTTIRISDNWVLRQSRQDFGMVAHEMLHVIQRYPGGRGAGGIPTWAMEGITDFARHAYYEPGVQMRPTNPEQSKYTDSYQVTGGFFMWIEHAYDKEFVKKLNQHARSRTWSDDVFEKYTGKGPEELWKEYGEFLRTIEGTRILPSRDFDRAKLGNTYSVERRPAERRPGGRAAAN